MEWVPTDNPVVETVATPELFKVPVPMVAEPFLNVTVPVAVAPEAGVTFAVKLTDFPSVEGFSDEVSVVVVAICSTVWVRVAEVLVRSSVLPLYTA
jgi:hypothetical protein